MAALAKLPVPKQILLDQLVSQLSHIDGMAAVVLGGSYASGTHHADSDLDIGLYYFADKPFSIADIRRTAEGVSTGSDLTVTGFYEWGPWVNGGAWIHTQAGKVDFLYRNLDQVQRTIDEAQRGISSHDFDQQPTYGFYSVAYLAETHICIPLFDPQDLIAGLKRLVEVYPPALKQAIIADSLWSAEFTLLFARNYAAQGDVYNTAGCITRAISNLTQAIFALNERYFISDKRVMEMLAAFPLLPSGYIQQIERLLSRSGWTAPELSQTVAGLELIWREVVSLAGERYQPKFNL